MKKILFITVLSVALIIQSCAPKSDNEKVPEKVLSAFKAKFPDVKKVEREMEDESEWKAKFKWNGKEYSANFNDNGYWMETEYVIEEPEIAEALTGKSYEMEIEVGEEEFDVTINSKGY